MSEVIPAVLDAKEIVWELAAAWILGMAFGCVLYATYLIAKRVGGRR